MPFQLLVVNLDKNWWYCEKLFKDPKKITGNQLSNKIMDPNQFLEVIILDSRRNWIYKTCKMKMSVFGISLLLTCYKSKLILITTIFRPFCHVWNITNILSDKNAALSKPRLFHGIATSVLIRNKYDIKTGLINWNATWTEREVKCGNGKIVLHILEHFP